MNNRGMGVVNFNHEAMRAARLKANLTQEQVGGRVGDITASSVSSWERGLSVPRIEKFPLLCAALDVDPGDLLWSLW